jgi:predicted cytidylate kinase
MFNKLTRFSSIAVSGQACSGKSTICHRLSDKLGWQHVNIGEEFRRLAARNHLAIEEFGSVPEKELRRIDTEIIHRIRKEPNIIWDGRLACYLSRGIENVFKVYCLLPIETRSERLANREKIAFKDAESRIMKRDVEEKEVFKRLYALSDPYSPEWVNLKVETLEPLEILVEQILSCML